MQHIIDDLIFSLSTKSPNVIVSIIGSSGSAPRTSGARMLVHKDGSIVGSIGGGAVEGNCISSAMDLFQSGENDLIIDYDLQPGDAASLGMVCGGAVKVLLQKGDFNDLELFQELNEQYKKGKQPILLTHLPIAEQRAYFSLLKNKEKQVNQKIIFELQQNKKRGPFLFSVEEKTIFVEEMVHPGTVHLMGAGHVALATAKIAHFSHFDIVVVDDRKEFANVERYPEAKEIKVLGSFTGCCKDLGVSDYVVIVTRGHIHDRDVLADALKTDAIYIGMIGSSRKIKTVYDSLLASGFSQDDLDRVHSPIGLSIGADTPEEIAISIVSQLIQVRAGK
ncbi:MAG: XdhC family protein [Desulfotalea sp.]